MRLAAVKLPPGPAVERTHRRGRRHRIEAQAPAMVPVMIPAISPTLDRQGLFPGVHPVPLLNLKL